MDEGRRHPDGIHRRGRDRCYIHLVGLQESIARGGRPVPGFGVGAVVPPIGVGFAPAALALAGHAASAATGLMMEHVVRSVVRYVRGAP